MSTELAPTPKQKAPATVRDIISEPYFKAQIATALPKHMTPDRFVRVALTAMLKTPKLLECTKESVLECLLNCSALGIEPDGRRAHLIPYGNKCTLIIDYKGIVELAKRSGDIANVFSQIVCDRDEFQWENGEITHRIDWRQARGEVYAVYSTVTFKDGAKQSDVMTRDEVEKIRKRSRAGESGPWVTDWSEMAKKTSFRRLSKWLTLSPEVSDALEKDGDNFSSLTVDTSLTQNKPDFSPAAITDGDGDLGPQPANDKPKRGRPAKAPVDATIVSPPAEQPPAAPAPAPAAPAAKSTINFVRGIRGMLTLSQISEDELLEYGRVELGWDESLGELEQVQEIQPSKLESAYTDWENISKAIKLGRQQ